jgi:hypothetical protein
MQGISFMNLITSLNRWPACTRTFFSIVHEASILVFTHFQVLYCARSHPKQGALAAVTANMQLRPPHVG